MRILVTGGAGYVGSVSVERLLEAGHEVVVLDDLSTGHRAAADGATLVAGSYGDPPTIATVLEQHRIEAILHCAARSLVAESIADPAKYYRDNVAGGIALLEAIRGAGIRRLVFSSTAAVYGAPTTTPIAEDAPLDPINPYGETKRTFEGALAWYGEAYGLRSVSLRYFNAAGATARSGEAHAPETHLIPLVLAAAAGRRPKVSVFGDDYDTPDGTAVRDYIHVEDLGEAHLLALAHLRRGGESRCLNLGNGTGYSVLEVIETARRVTGLDVPFEKVPRREGDPPRLVGDSREARAVLGWAPKQPSLEAIVRSAWAWQQSHPGGYGTIG